MKAECPCTILLVDDQPDNSDTMMSYLSESNSKFKFLQAINGKIACKVAQKRQPELIILDWEMPEMNGYEALLELKNNPITENIPVIMATGRSSGADLEKALTAGAADYIRKPIEKLELLARVRTCLNLSRYIKEINNKNEELKAYDRMVSHDLKGPIGHIVSFAGFIKKEDGSKLSEENQKYLDQILNSGKASQKLIDDILIFASADEPAELEEEINLTEQVNKAVESHSLTIEKNKAKIKIGDLPTLDSGISVKVYQLFYNLIGNALKFQKDGVQPEVSVTASKSELIVQDNGIGFDQKHAQDIFSPFKRINNEIKYEGHGIGLGTCKRIADLHGWEIRAESEPGKGARFIISLNP